MDQEKIGKFIKEIRKKNNLTQKEFADKYNVTYQAVSKWENGLNMPDNALIKQICKDFNISLEELYDGEYKEKKQKKHILIIIFVITLTVIGVIIFFSTRNNDFQFKTLSSECDNFNISGNISYNDKKSAIYITNIKYCGGDDLEEYQTIECTLYESTTDLEKKISTCKYDDNTPIKIEDYLEQVTLSVDNYEKTCKEYQNNSLYLLINATDKNNKITTYKIPLKLESNCKND